MWFYKIKRQESSVSVKAGLPEADFYLEAQESLDLPSILVMAYEGGNREAHNRFRRLIRDHYSPKIRFGDEMKMPFSLQTFDRYTYTVPSWNTEESQLQTMEYANRCGNTDTFWMDALWFTGGFPAGVGNYTFREGFPEGFKNISQILHKEGKRLMVWFEPERVVGGTQMSREHPELLMEYVLPPAKWVNNQETRLLDFSNPQVVDWIIDQISDFIRTYQIDIYRQDCNINPAPFWEASDMEGRKGITEIRYINGLYRFWDTLLERFPHLMIDMVAGGGNRIDLETSARCVYAWRSDTGCAPDSKEWKSSLWNQNQTMGLSDYVVYHGIAAWKPQAYDVRSAIANGFAANFDVFDENCDFEMLKVVLEEYGRLRRYWEDDFYPLTEADLQEDHWTGYQFGKESCGVMMLFRREKNGQAHKTFHFYGLNAEKNYRLVITDENYQSMEVTVIGKELLEGYEFTIENPRNSLTAEYLEL